MRRLPFALALLAAVLGGCGSQPAVSVFVGDESVPMALVSTSRITGWWAGEVGDAFPTELPLTMVRASNPVPLRLEAGPGASRIRGWIYDTSTSTPSGGPIEEFAVDGRNATYAPRTITPGHTYEIAVNVAWSGVLVHGEVTHAFRMNVAAP